MADGRVTRTAEAPGRATAPGALRPWWVAPVAIFAASRVVSTLLLVWVRSQATVRSRAGAHPSLLDLATAWDGQWYWTIADRGYPSVLPLTASGAVDTNQWAFLPVYPWVAKALTLGVLDWRIAAVALSVASGFAAAVLLLVLLAPRIGRSAALFAVSLFSCSPLAFLLQTAYAESLGLALLLGALVLIDRGRYLTALPVALLLAFTRPGILALALAVGLQVVLLVVAAVRAHRAVPWAEAVRGGVLAVVSAGAGFAWAGIAALGTGRPDAYFATEGAWRALWMPEGSITFFQPWFFAAEYWTRLAWGDATARWAGPLVVLLLVAAFAALLLSRPARRLGPTVRLWGASYALYLLAAFFPQSSVFRLLMPMAPLAGAVAPRRTASRAAVLAVSIALQALWLWVVLGPVQDYWTVP